MKKLFLIVAALFVAVSFSACSDDDDNKINPDQIVGTWMVIHEKGYSSGEKPGTIDDWDNTYPIDDYDGKFHYTYTFYADGTGWYKDYIDNKLQSEWSLTYSIKNNQLLLYEEPEGGNLSGAYDILSLTKTQLIIKYSERDGDNSFMEETTTFKKL